MVKVRSIGIAMLALLVFSAGCSNYGGNTYYGDETRTAQTVQRGTLVSVRPVAIQEKHAGTVGTVAGGAVGGIAGNMVGGGDGRTLATIAGVLVGAGVGNLAGKAVGSQQGLELTVRLDNGQEISVVQGDDQAFSVGDRVRILTGKNGTVRISY